MYDLTDDDLERYKESVDNRVRSLRQISQRIRERSLADQLNAADIRSFVDFLDGTRAFFIAVSSHAKIAQLVQYCKDQRGDQSWNLKTEVDAINVGPSGTVQSILAWILAAVPKNPGGNWLDTTDDGTSRIIHRIYSAAATAGLRTEIDGLVARIAVP